jgi:uncharacterized protein (DUF2147 family)
MCLKRFTGILFLSLCLLFINSLAHAQPDPIEHTWYNEAKTGKVQIYKANNGKFYGKIVWLKEPDRNGKPKLDINNPDKARRNDPEMGLLILKAFKKTGDGEYEDGTIYDPKNGKTYSCTMKLKDNVLDVHGYIMISLIGRSEKWTIAD